LKIKIRHLLGIYYTKIFSEEVRFHDPSEFAEQSNQDHVNYQQTVHGDESHNDHDDHRHGIGEDMDKE